ncbi:MAG: hypothetical protein ACP5VS_02585 [Desulfomonilaceae bacterium]
MPGGKLYFYFGSLAILVNLIILLPIAHSPYLGDDSWCESTLPGLLLLSNMSLSDLCWNTLKDYINSGRWYPLIIYYYPVFYFLNECLYKSAEILFVLVNIALFAYFVRLVTSSTSLGLMAFALPPLFVQFRCYHDPIMSYYFLMQIEFLLILMSLIFLTFYLRRSKMFFLTLSLAAWICCLLVYEAFYAFWIMHAAVAYLHFGRGSLRKIVKTTLPFFVLAVLNMLITLFIRFEFVPRYEGINLNFSIQAWFWAFLKQAFAAFPLSYFFSTGSFSHWTEVAGAYFATDLIVASVAWAIFWCFASDNFWTVYNPRRKESWKALVLLGLGFWLFPALLVTLSAKYQQQLKWGLGYLPVYVSSFGLMMLTLAFISTIYEAIRKSSVGVRNTILVVLTILGVAISGINYNSNRMVIQKYNFAEHYHRKLIESALHGNLMRFVPEGSYVICGAPVRSWDTPAFFRMHSGLTLQVAQLSGFCPDIELGTLSIKNAFSSYLEKGCSDRYDFTKFNKADKHFSGYKVAFVGVEGPILKRVVTSDLESLGKRVFYLKYEAKFQNEGYAVLARATRLQANNEEIAGVVADKLWIYVAVPVGYPYSAICLRGTWIDHRTLIPSGTFQFTDKELIEISSDPHGKLFELPLSLGGKCVDPKSITADLTVTDDSPSRFTNVMTQKNSALNVR